MAEVVLDKINKLYENGFHAVKDLSIDVADGEFLVLVGPSGCGKSTALRMVAGLEDISTGDLLIGGRRVNDVDPQGRDIAMVFQSYALYPHMSVADNIAYGLKLRKMPKDEMNRRIQRAADMLELTPLLDRKPKQLSGGQRQRVAMGRSIVREPQVFLMDEPLSNLDAKLRVQMRAEISAVVRSLNTTTLYVTHDQTEAMTMGDRMAVLKAGVLNQLGTPTECYDTPNNIFVAQFVGSPPMNLVLADIKDGANGLELHVGGSTLEIPSSTLDERPTLKGYAGKQVALGVRSEDMEDASIARVPDGAARQGQGHAHRGARLGDHRPLHLPGAEGRHRGHQAPGEGGRRRRAARAAGRGRQVGGVVRAAVSGAHGRRGGDRGRRRAGALLRPRDVPGHPELTGRLLRGSRSAGSAGHGDTAHPEHRRAARYRVGSPRTDRQRPTTRPSACLAWPTSPSTPT